MVSAISGQSFFEILPRQKVSELLAHRVTKLTLNILFEISIIGLVAYAIFYRMTKYPEFLELAVQDGNEENVIYYLGCGVPPKGELLFKTTNVPVLQALLAAGADKKMIHEGKSLIEHLYTHLTSHGQLRGLRYNPEAKPLLDFMSSILFDPSDLDKAIHEAKWDFAALLMYFDQRDPRPPHFRTEHPELLRALVAAGADQKATYEEKTIVEHFVSQGREDLAQAAWDDSYLKDEIFPNLEDILPDCRRTKTKLADHPKFKFRKFLEKKRFENPLKVVIVNHGPDPVRIFKTYQEIGIDRLETCFDQLGTPEEIRKGVWTSIAGQFLLFKISSQIWDWGFDEELIKFGEKGLNLHELDEKIRGPVKEKIKDGYPPSLIFFLFILGKGELLRNLVERGYIDLSKCIHPDDREAVFQSQDPIVQSYVGFLITLAAFSTRAAGAARSAVQAAGGWLRERGVLSVEERSS